MSNKEWRVYTKAADFNGLAKEFNIDPVSYTHLDVYKRQVL